MLVMIEAPLVPALLCGVGLRVWGLPQGQGLVGAGVSCEAFVGSVLCRFCGSLWHFFQK